MKRTSGRVKNIGKDIRERDAIDFASEDIGSLFRRMFLPTLLGMVSMVALNLADGAFVGHGAGTEALAAVNIAAPIFDLMIGMGIMFGIGCSVISSIHLSKGNVKAARINATQSLIGSFLATGIIGVLILTNLAGTCRLFGSNEALIPLASSYLRWVAMALPFCILGNVGSFVVRLDGSPKYAMACTLSASVMNIFLDWLFVFPLKMGLEGAAIATSISFTLSAMAVIYYLVFLSRTLHFYRLRMTVKSLMLTGRNLWYQIKAGFSAMLGQVAISFTVIVGNYVFIRYLGEDGVAAYGVVCYILPIVFMIASAIVQSIQPILSFAYGAGDVERMCQARNIAVRGGVIGGILSSLVLILCSRWVTLIFIPSGEAAYDLCTGGLKYFGIAGLFVSVNLVMVGYLQSVKRSGMATLYSSLRGFLLLLLCFILLPIILGNTGIWLAIPVSEALTLAIMSVVLLVSGGRCCGSRRTRRS